MPSECNCDMAQLFRSLKLEKSEVERETLAGRDGTGLNYEMVVSGVEVKITLICSMCICSLVTSLLILHAVLKSSDAGGIKLVKEEMHRSGVEWTGYVG